MAISAARKLSIVISKLTFGLFGYVLTPQDYMNEARVQLNKERENLRSNLVKVFAASESLERKMTELTTQISNTEHSIKSLLKTGGTKAEQRAAQEAARIVALRAAVQQVETALRTQTENATRTQNLIHVLDTKAIELETQIANLETAEMVAQVTGSATAANWDKHSYRRFMDEAARIVNEKYDTSRAQTKASEVLGEDTHDSLPTSSAAEDELERIRKSMAAE